MTTTRALDSIDRRLLALLQADGRMPNAEVARRLSMAASATYERIRRLEREGAIRRYEANVDPAAVDLGLVAFLSVQCVGMQDMHGTAERLAEIASVLEVHHVAGEDCFLVKVRAADTRDLAVLLRDTIGQIPGVQSTRTTIALDTYKETTALPLKDSPGARSGY